MSVAALLRLLPNGGDCRALLDDMKLSPSIAGVTRFGDASLMMPRVPIGGLEATSSPDAIDEHVPLGLGAAAGARGGDVVRLRGGKVLRCGRRAGLSVGLVPELIVRVR